jgi:hypothetical protein
MKTGSRSREMFVGCSGDPKEVPDSRPVVSESLRSGNLKLFRHATLHIVARTVPNGAQEPTQLNGVRRANAASARDESNFGEIDRCFRRIAPYRPRSGAS